MTKHQQFLINTVTEKGESTFIAQHGIYTIHHYKLNGNTFSVLTIANTPIDIIVLSED